MVDIVNDVIVEDLMVNVNEVFVMLLDYFNEFKNDVEFFYSSFGVICIYMCLF